MLRKRAWPPIQFFVFVFVLFSFLLNPRYQNLKARINYNTIYCLWDLHVHVGGLPVDIQCVVNTA